MATLNAREPPLSAGPDEADGAAPGAWSPSAPKVVYWHRDLPPLDGVVLAEHIVEATSHRVPGTLAHRDTLWDECYGDLMTRTEDRLRQEIERLGGRYAHVLEESIDSQHNEATGESWLHGRFTYTLFG
ncbi:MAG: hypothetical protein ACT4QD_08305 [Acidobacteriota bacterium]